MSQFPAYCLSRFFFPSRNPCTRARAPRKHVYYSIFWLCTRHANKRVVWHGWNRPISHTELFLFCLSLFLYISFCFSFSFCFSCGASPNRFRVGFQMEERQKETRRRKIYLPPLQKKVHFDAVRLMHASTHFHVNYPLPCLPYPTKHETSSSLRIVCKV